LRFVRRYLIPRIVQWALVIWLGITLVFIFPRLLPGDPAERMIDKILAPGLSSMYPAAMEEMIRIVRELYGLEAGLLEQYTLFWERLLSGDFGPSLYAFPTPVTELIGRALPWTLGLLLVTTVLSWIIGIILGGLTGYFSGSRILRIIDGMAMVMRPLPHYIVGLLLIIFFAHLLPVFPIGGGYSIGARLSFTWRSAMDVLKHAFLPAMSLMLLGVPANHQTMRLLIQSAKDEDYVRFARIGGVKERIVFARYVMRNAILPQVTALAMMIGVIFSGALIVEIVFSYPGIGFLLYRSILATDYNLLMGIMTISIVAITTCILLIDFLYPLIDPRIRFK